MAKPKKPGRARSAAPRSKSRPAGPISSIASSGIAPGERRSTIPRLRVRGPYYSAARREWRIVCEEPDPTLPGGEWTASYYCEREADADRLERLVRQVHCREDFLALWDAVQAVAASSDGFIYRTILGQPRELAPGRQTQLPQSRY